MRVKQRCNGSECGCPGGRRHPAPADTPYGQRRCVSRVAGEEAEGAVRWWPRKERRLAVGFPPPHSTHESGVTVMSVEAEAAF